MPLFDAPGPTPIPTLSIVAGAAVERHRAGDTRGVAWPTLAAVYPVSRCVNGGMGRPRQR